MDYDKIYKALIKKAVIRNAKRDKNNYYEEHHILAKCLGGDENSKNKVFLTAREHFLAHWLLVRANPGNFKLIYAWNCFCMSTHNGNRPTSRNYEIARLSFVKMLSENEEWKKKMRNSLKKKIWLKKGTETIRIFKDDIDEYLASGWVYGRIIKNRSSPSESTRKKMSIAMTGKKHSEETKRKMSNSLSKKRWITKDGESKMVDVDIAHRFISLGWKMGRIIAESY